MTTFRLERDGNLPLEFTGELLTEQTTRFDRPGKQSRVQWDERNGRPRWSELRIYRTASDKWVLEMVGHTTIEDELTFRSVRVCDDPSIIPSQLRALTDTSANKPFPEFVLDALDEAAQADPRLVGALVEKV